MLVVAIVGIVMTDAEQEQLEARIQAIADEWILCLGLQWWHISFYYHGDSGAYRDSSVDIPAESKAYTSASWAYLDAAIHYNLSGLSGYDDAHLEEVVLHELMHVMVHEMRAVAACDCDTLDMRHEERVCTILQRAFVWTKGHFRDAAKSDTSPEITGEPPTDAD